MSNSVIWCPKNKDLKMPDGVEENIVYNITAVGESSYIGTVCGNIICDLTGFIFIRTYFKEFGYIRYGKAILNDSLVGADGRVVIPMGSMIEIISVYSDGDVRIKYNGRVYTAPYYYLTTLFQNRNSVIDEILNE